MIRKDNIVTKFEKLHGEYSSSRKVESAIGGSNLERKVFEVLLDNLLGRGTRECADHDDQPGGQRVPPRPTGPGRRGRMGGVDSVLAAQETRQSLRLEKAAAFSARKQEEAAASSLVAQLESSPSSSSNTSAVVSDKNTEQLGGASPAKRAKRATKNIVSPALAATLDRTKLTDRSATYVLTEAARCLGQNVEELNINRSSIDANA
ncbi:hypothetical protein GWK47_002293 [Chionoecetes opilio]|uniref:Uncharacterized protein n=1 Tax=Chionoecetes opilio TaxID=41210 RepID=A0A8J5CEZ2_CHIOP|nr:hypothetical protein GWK47_002293 [Chionoecetes opilio]